MNSIKYFIIVGIALLFIGCPARSLFPLFVDKDLVFNPQFIGTWASQQDEETQTFRKAGEKSYNIITLDKDGNAESHGAQLGQLGKFWFLDTYPLKEKDGWQVSSHILCRVWLNVDTLRVACLESDWLKKMIDAKKLTIPHVRREGEIILTANTEELQQLVLRYADDTGAFPNPGTFIRMK